MHNCKTTRERVTELVLDGANGPSDGTLSAELRGCAECRAEFEALKETLRITTTLIKKAAPAEAYWTGYHARLKQKLRDAKVPPIEASEYQVDSAVSGPSRLIRFFTSSVPVPVPVGMAFMLVFSLSLLLAIRAYRQKNSLSESPSIVRVPLAVPVIQEKTVTRVVYRQRERQSVSRKSSRTISPSRSNSALARSQKLRNEENPVSLIGFKPLDEIKLTVIKGGFPNEK